MTGRCVSCVRRPLPSVSCVTQYSFVRSFVESHTAHTLFRAAIAFAVVGVVRRLFISEVCGADRRSITQLGFPSDFLPRAPTRRESV